MIETSRMPRVADAHQRRFAPLRPLGDDPTFNSIESLVEWDDRECGILGWAQFAGPSAAPYIRAAVARIKRVRAAHAHLIAPGA